MKRIKKDIQNINLVKESVNESKELDTIEKIVTKN